jgi:hypothetical protein
MHVSAMAPGAEMNEKVVERAGVGRWVAVAQTSTVFWLCPRCETESAKRWLRTLAVAN